MIYLFRCPKCGEIELNIKVAELSMAKCPHCLNENIERIWSAVSSVWNCNGNYGKSTNNGG